MGEVGLTEKQLKMIAYGQSHPYAIIAADMRTGKSRAAIEIAKSCALNCLIVCPAYLIANWKKEILKWSPSSSVTMFRKGKDIYDVCDSDFVVTSYDLIKKAEHLFEWADMVVADEIHALKNMAAKRTEFFHRAVYENSVKRLYGLTGTPIKNRVKEFYSLLALMNYNPDLKETSFLDTYPDEITFAEHFSFSETYDVRVSKGKKTWKMPVTSYYGIRNVEELKSWLRGRYIRIKAGPKDLPPISYLDTLVSDIDNAALLAAFNNYFVSDVDIRKLVKAKKITEAQARQMRTGSVLPEHKRNAAIQKTPFAIQYIENLLETVPCCLVYSDHREPIEKIAAHFKVPAITGSVPAAKRGQLVEDFQAGKLNILCATIGSLKEGADLYRARDMVLVDPSWIPGDISQVINRMRAMGEKHPRTVHRIMGSPQDEKIWQVLQEKMDTIQKAT
jgi:superfamily II DNA or RNA helicase